MPTTPTQRITEEPAHGPSLLQSVGRAWVQVLARTTVGSKVLRAAYESYFEAASGHQRMFRGLYPDFAAAVADAPPGKQVGYDGDATATRHAHERHFLFPSDYAVLFWLSRFIGGAKLLFDLGGDVGARYLAFRKYLDYPENMIWLVNDIPAVVALGRTIAEQEAAVHLEFTSDYARLGEADILLASGVLQVLEDWNGFLHRATHLPRHLLINRTPVGDQPDAVTLHSIGVSFVPYHIFNRQSFIGAFINLGYLLVDEWRASESRCWIPKHPSYCLDSYSGFYFVLDPPGPGGRGASVDNGRVVNESYSQLKERGRPKKSQPRATSITCAEKTGRTGFNRLRSPR
jgi:putative methyltransferase (TIGR04325 family)